MSNSLKSDIHYVILRDDDTNALTPVDLLDRLYRPFLERALPVNLAVIPNVATDAVYAQGCPELFLMAKSGRVPPLMAIGESRELICYLRTNPGLRVVQHGCRHDFVHGAYEFNHPDRTEIARRLDEGIACFEQAGFGRPQAFVAPYDRLSRPALEEAAARYPVLSTGWFELRRLPVRWWPRYLLKKSRGHAHWKAGGAWMLSHPGCHLSFHRPYDTMLETIIRSIRRRRLTVLVTHWWEYFRDQRPDKRLIDILHRTADHLAGAKDVRVISFEDLAAGTVEPN